MSHLVENMISTKGQVPWHGLGVVTPKELVTAEEIIKEIDFDFKVVKRQNFVSCKGKFIETPDSFSTVRVNSDGTEIPLAGKLGSNYTPIQNTEAFEFFDHVVDKGEAIYETAGILKNGCMVFLLAVLPDYIKILGSTEDQIRKFVLLANWHDGKSALIAQFTNVRVVCNNTLNMALQSADSRVSIRHTKNAKEMFAEASRTMGLVNQYNIELEKAFNKLALTKITPDQLVAYINSLLPCNEDATAVVKRHITDNREKIIHLFEHGKGAQLETSHNTLWGAYNAVTEYVDHETNFSSVDARANSLLFGNGQKVKQLAFDKALELVN